MSPWLGSSFELQAKTGAILQRSTKIDAAHTIQDDDTGQLYCLGIQGTYEFMALEVVVNAAHTKHRSLGFSHATQTGRIQFSDDIIGDDYSITAGLSLSEVMTQTLHDVTFIHQGHIEGLLFLSVGKELSTSWTRWCQRTYGVMGLGIADHAFPWLYGSAHYEWASPVGHIAGIGGSFDIGCGSKNVHLHHFKGYGNIKYRAIDLEAYYNYAFDRATFLKALIDVRVYSKNCPNAVSFALFYLVGFGL